VSFRLSEIVLGAALFLAPGNARATDVVLAPVKITGAAQVDWVVFRQSSQNEVNGSNGEPLNEDRFLLRAARLRARVERGIVEGRLEIDANTIQGPQVRPVNTEVSLRWPGHAPAYGEPYIKATMGLFRTPFGFDTQEEIQRRPFLEPCLFGQALFPGAFDLGLRLRGGFRFVNYTLGIMNGDPIGQRVFPGRDPDKSKDLVFRVGVESSPRGTVRVAGGFSGVTGMGFHQGTPATKDVFTWNDVNEDGIVDTTEIQTVPGRTATPSERFRRFALGADLRAATSVPVLGELAVRGEIARANNLDRGVTPADPIAMGRDQRGTGYYFDVVQEVTRYAVLGVRYDFYNPDSDANEQAGVSVVPRDPSLSTLSIMAAFRYADGAVVAGQADALRAIRPARFILQYDHRKNASGRALGGDVTTLADDSLTLRGEVSF
jgi:hypothetical protein